MYINPKCGKNKAETVKTSHVYKSIETPNPGSSIVTITWAIITLS